MTWAYGHSRLNEWIFGGMTRDLLTSSPITAGVTYETMHVEHDQPCLAIIETAARKSCDLIVMTSHGRRGISAIVLRSETVKVLTHNTIPVLVVRAPHQGFFTGLASLT